MVVIRILILCVAAAVASTMLRAMHPQMASVTALAAGTAALMLSVPHIRSFAEAVRGLEEIAQAGGMDHILLMKLCGLAVIAEFASDICRDAGEGALAHRIDMAVRLGIMAGALPLASELMETISRILA